jgi:hypothetical protein
VSAQCALLVTLPSKATMLRLWQRIDSIELTLDKIPYGPVIGDFNGMRPSLEPV